MHAKDKNSAGTEEKASL